MADETLGLLDETLGMIRATSDWGGAPAGKQAISHNKVITHELIDSSEHTNRPEAWEDGNRMRASRKHYAATARETRIFASLLSHLLLRIVDGARKNPPHVSVD